VVILDEIGKMECFSKKSNECGWRIIKHNTIDMNNVFINIINPVRINFCEGKPYPHTEAKIIYAHERKGSLIF